MHIPHRLNSCTSLLSMNDNRTWQDFTQAKIKTPFSFAKPRKHISYYSLLQIAHDLICLFSSDPLRKFLVLSCRSSTLKRPSILCSVRDSGVSFYNNKPLENCFATQTRTSSRGTKSSPWGARISDLFLKTEEINQIIALCIFSSDTRALETLGRVISYTRVGGRTESK